MGASSLTVSAIALGTVAIGESGYGPADDAESLRTVARALDLGVTTIDTSPVYGRAEDLLGRALAGKREQVVLVTKCGLVRPSEGRGSGPDSRRETIQRGVEDSLRRLRTDYVDLLLIHWPDPQTTIGEAMGALNDLLAAGRTRFLGVSNYSAAQLREARQHAPVVCNEVGYNLFDRRWEREVFPTALELGVGIMAYWPMAFGLLSGTLSRDTIFERGDGRASGQSLIDQALFGPDTYPRNLAVVERLKGVAARLNTTVARLALAWVLAHPALACAISGAKLAGEIEENALAADLTLDETTLADIAEIMRDAPEVTPVAPAVPTWARK